MTLDFSDSIAGVATAPGQAGVAIIRISGPEAIQIGNQLFRPAHGKLLSEQGARRLIYGWVTEGEKDLDEALACYMPGPHSFTAEDVVEIQAHGGIYLSGRILELCLKQGARMARPGEFTQRAFINGRIDLTRAEAIGEITKAKTGLALEIGINQLKGRLYESIQGLKEKIVWAHSLINAGIDFPEEDVVFTHEKQIRTALQDVSAQLIGMLEGARGSMMIRNGFKAALTGRPNVGKSSLLNGLLNEDRAIVTDLPGTTRDLIEESIDLGGIPLVLSDTAGIRDTKDKIEQIGITKSLRAVKEADLILWVVDATDPDLTLLEEEAKIKGEKPVFLLVNKCDLAAQPPLLEPPIPITMRIDLAAINHDQILKLKETLGRYMREQVSGSLEETSLTNLRQTQAAEAALKAVEAAAQALGEGMGEELLSVDLANALNHLGEIVGETTPDDILNGIFSNFCIGK